MYLNIALGVYFYYFLLYKSSYYMLPFLFVDYNFLFANVVFEKYMNRIFYYPMLTIEKY